ncbi:putative protein-disulfide isomerase [Crossiella equi]|uniref:DSBA-like thioredoxin domain-containing protein n=1 Tax=Crossiella equi TaxID=130796 RepID=A0ABS5A5W2_9PSEU|nr:DsbA family protein [Crossiella equi]MBP2471983.1 putative protein-disulfide isomerase [Crossiella equi]
MVRLSYVVDVHCPWCHGFSAVLADFAEAAAGRVDIEVLPAWVQRRGAAGQSATRAATALVALREPDGVAAVLALHEAWFTHGHDLADPRVHRALAVRLGLDPDAVAAAVAAPRTRDRALADFRTARRLGVLRYPALLVRTASGADHLGGPVATAEDLLRALDQHLAHREGTP